MTVDHSREEYVALLDGIPDSVFVLDDEGDVWFVNRRVVDGVGAPRDEILGTHYTAFADLLESDSAVEAFTDAVEAVLAGEASGEQRLDVAIDTADAGRLEVEARIVPQHAGVMIVMRDITDRVETTERLATMTDHLALVNRLLRHDIRNQLTVIKGWTQELETTADGDAAAITERLTTAVEKAIRLTREAREVTEALETTGELQTRPVRLDAIVERAIETARNEFPDADVVGPETCPEVEVEANELLESVFRNLLTNAVVHNDSDTPTVAVTGTLEDDAVAVSVADDGPGIPDSEKPRIFDRDRKGADSSGAGLGLFLVDFLVDAYGGSVSVSDNEPRGTVFTVRLPVAEPED